MAERNMADRMSQERWKLGSGWLAGVDFVRVDETRLTRFADSMKDANPDLIVPQSSEELVDLIAAGITKRRQERDSR